MYLIISLRFLQFFPDRKKVGIGAELKNATAKRFQLLVVIACYRRAHKANGIFPYIMAADQLVIGMTVDKGKASFGKIVGSVNLCCIVIVKRPGSFGGVQQTVSI